MKEPRKPPGVSNRSPGMLSKGHLHLAEKPSWPQTLAAGQDDAAGEQGSPANEDHDRGYLGNANGHGLPAASRPPGPQGQSLTDAFIREFRLEWRPTSMTEAVLVAELGRHAAALERAQRAELAAVCRSADAFGSLLQASDSAVNDPGASALAAGLASDALDRLARYRRGHERGFHAACARLAELRRSRQSQAISRFPAAPAVFADENACEQYLRNRIETGASPCPDCGAAAGWWLATRHRFQCADCRRQRSVRSGTLMARSQLPLKVWFDAIREVVFDPDIRTEKLADAMGISRAATVRAAARLIRQALVSPRADQLLAGLPSVFLAGIPSYLRQVLAGENSLQERAFGIEPPRALDDCRKSLAEKNFRTSAGRRATGPGDGCNLRQASLHERLSSESSTSDLASQPLKPR